MNLSLRNIQSVKISYLEKNSDICYSRITRIKSYENRRWALLYIINRKFELKVWIILAYLDCKNIWILYFS